MAGSSFRPIPDPKRYLLSLPERVVRSTAAVSAGLLRELGEVALPGTLRRTKFYRTLVAETLRFLIEEVGGVEGVYSPVEPLSDKFAVRRAAGNGIELVGILTLRASPVWILAALADVTGAGRHLIQEIAQCLKREGLLDPCAKAENLDQILDGLEKTALQLTDTINTPPLDLKALRHEWTEIRGQLRRIPPANLPSPERLWAQWRSLHEVAAAQDRTVFQLSSLMALSAMERLPDNLRWLSRSVRLSAKQAGRVVAEPLLDHYSKTLEEIRTTGFLSYWRRQFRPYLRAAAFQFSRDRATLTERLIRPARGKESPPLE